MQSAPIPKGRFEFDAIELLASRVEIELLASRVESEL